MSRHNESILWSRHRRLRKIARAQEQIEHELLFAKKQQPTLSNDLAFRELYYLVGLAKNAPPVPRKAPSRSLKRVRSHPCDECSIDFDCYEKPARCRKDGS